MFAGWQAILSPWGNTARIGPYGPDISHKPGVVIARNSGVGENNHRNADNGVEQT